MGIGKEWLSEREGNCKASPLMLYPALMCHASATSRATSRS